MHSTLKSGLGLAALGLLGLLAAPSAHAAAGPISKLYLTAGDQGQNFIVQGTTATASAQAAGSPGGEYAIAVSGNVSTLGNGNPGDHGPGAVYDLNFTDTGGRTLYPAVSASFYDGTTDGTHNYSVDYSGGQVYQMDRSWQNPVALFQIPQFDLGITYDQTNNSLWVANFSNGSTVTDYGLDGTVLSSFNTTFSAISDLSLDPADNTLWMGSQGGGGTLYQYSKTGVFLQSQTYTALANANTLGGEFNVAAPAVPEASTTVSLGLLLALGLGGLMVARKKSVKG